MQTIIVEAIQSGIFKWRSIPALARELNISEEEIKITLDFLVEKGVIYQNQTLTHFAVTKKEKEEK